MLWDQCDLAASSHLAYAEMCAAIAAAGRDRRLSPGDERAARLGWEDFWAVVRPIGLTASVARHAGQLAGQHALRGADAVHLASALSLGIEDLVFAAWDGRLRDGARAAGLELAPADV